MSNALLLGRGIVARNQDRLTRTPLLLLLQMLTVLRVSPRREDSTAITRLHPSFTKGQFLEPAQDPPLPLHTNGSPAAMGKEVRRESPELQIVPVNRRHRSRGGDIDVHSGREAPPGARVPAPRRARGGRRGRHRGTGGRRPDEVPLQGPLGAAGAPMLRPGSRRVVLARRGPPLLGLVELRRGQIAEASGLGGREGIAARS